VEILPRTAALDAGFSADFGKRVARRLGQSLPVVSPGSQGETPQPLPYEQLFEAERAFAQAKKLARKTAERIGGLTDFLGSPHDD
ncbi:MAG: hypothetical protein HY902_05150, partial [Deltaproteobacteria bacterium]|nr:hypothetical protein [Deltaproteobacteria bacterium]